jgi:DNA polymerase-3 subunit epsilon
MYAVIDFETTNLKEDRRATEVAIAVLDSELNVILEFESLVKPVKAVYRHSLGYSRLTLKELEQAPTFAEIWPTIASLVSGKILVMHNSQFDSQVLSNELAAMSLEVELPPTVCTLIAARRVLPGRSGEGPYKLENLAEEFGFDSPDSHQAMVDVRMTIELFKALLDRDRELKLICEVLVEDVVEYASAYSAKSPVPRVRFHAESESESGLEQMASEISRNVKVQETRQVCLTGSLLDRPGIERELAKAGFALVDAETTKGTAFLIQGAKAGKRKVDKALNYGRPVLTEQDAFSLTALLI